jgi:hypothetical protein
MIENSTKVKVRKLFNFPEVKVKAALKLRSKEECLKQQNPETRCFLGSMGCFYSLCSGFLPPQGSSFWASAGCFFLRTAVPGLGPAIFLRSSSSWFW